MAAKQKRSSASRQHLEGRRRFVEDMGMVFGGCGRPRMTGRCFGWLLVCDPPHQTAAELASALSASKGSISTTMNMLLRFGFVERFGVSGDRVVRYRVGDDAWSKMMALKVEGVKLMRVLAERGLKLLKNSRAPLRRRLRDMLDIYKFFERELPAMMERYERQRAAKGRAR